MGTRERKQREFAEREQAFLNAAFELIREEGLLNLQMSRVAERCEYAVGTLYLHFSCKEDLLLALVTDRVRDHVHLFLRAGNWKSSTRDRIFATAVADMIFVRRHPEYFRIAQYSLCEVVWKAASPERRQAFLDVTGPIGEIVVGIVNDAVAAGDLDLCGQSPQALATGQWALCSGFHNLVHAEGVLRDFTVQEPYQLMCRQIHNLLNGLGWKPLIQIHDHACLRSQIERVCAEVFDETICHP